MNSGHTIHSGHSVIIVGIRDMATTSDWLISLSRFSNASLIERIQTHAAVAARVAAGVNAPID